MYNSFDADIWRARHAAWLKAVGQELTDTAISYLAVHSYGKIEKRMCKVFKVSRADLLSHRRNEVLVSAREAICYWAYRLTKLSLPAIGRLMHRDHSSIVRSRDMYPAKRASMGRHLRALPGGRKGDAA